MLESIAKQPAESAAPKVSLYISWPEKKAEIGELRGDEGPIAMNWTVYENLVFFFMWWLGTY
jgi:hypothetical protein